MNLPFSREQFFQVFARYNDAIWPMQIALIAIAVGCVVAAFTDRVRHSVIGWALAFLWAWMAVAYHFAFFTRINPIAWLFGTAYLAGAGLFARHAWANKLRFTGSFDVDYIAGILLIAYALVGYPLAARIAGQRYPAVPTFGLPCPTTIFTLGLLLLGRHSVPLALFMVPIAWSVIGALAAFHLGVTEDYGLLAAGVITVLVLLKTRVALRKGAAPHEAST